MLVAAAILSLVIALVAALRAEHHVRHATEQWVRWTDEARALRSRAEAAEARVAELTAPDGDLRPTIVIGDAPRSPDETTHAAQTSRHRIGTRGAL